MNIELRRIVGPYGIVAGSGNYTLIREVMFNVGKENEYLKDPIKDWAAIYKDMPGWAKRVGYKSPGSQEEDDK